MATQTTRSPWIHSSNDTHGHSGLDPSSLDSLTFSQILLPVVCAVFISLVVVVIACCLIQRKPKSVGKWRNKSCHTIETSHETSDIGVYDVIDEINVSTCTPEKTARQSTKLDANYILGSHLLHHSKSHDLLPAAITPVIIPVHVAPNVPVGPLKRTPHPRRNVHCPGQASACVQKRPYCPGEVDQDEGIYETLDRHSIFRNEGDEHTQLPSIDRSLSFYHRDMNHISRNVLQSNNTYETLNWRREFETSCSLCHYQKDNSIIDASQDLRTAPPAFQTAESNKIVCQLSMFKVSDTHEKTTLIDKAYYRVQSQTTACVCASSPDISTMFHNRSLRLVHHRLPEKSPDCGNGHDLILKPVCDAGGYVNNLKDSNTFANNLQKILMSQQSPLAVDSQRHHEFPKQYENLKATNSDLCASIIPEHCVQHSGGCNISTPIKCSDIHNTYSDLTTSSEATRISAKLGPLPPLPVEYNVLKEMRKSHSSPHQSHDLKFGCSQTTYPTFRTTQPVGNIQYNVLNEMRKSHSSPHQSNDLKFGCSQTKYPTSRTTQPVGNIHRNQHISTSVCQALEIAHDKRSRANILNQEVDLLTCRVHSLNTRYGSDFRKISADILFATSTKHVGDNDIPFATSTKHVGDNDIPFATSTRHVGDNDIPFATSTRHVGDNTKVDCCNENSNVYFILEPASDVSSLNSDTEDTAECQPTRNHHFR